MKECSRRRSVALSSRSCRASSAIFIIVITFLILPAAASWLFNIDIPFLHSKDGPSLDLEIDAPNHVANGESVSYRCLLKNTGGNAISAISVADGFSEIGFIDTLSPGEAVELNGTTPPIDKPIVLNVTACSGGVILASREMAVDVTGSTGGSGDGGSSAALQGEVEAVPSDGGWSVCKYRITNSGDVPLSRVRVIGPDGSVLGILPILAKGETQTLKMSSKDRLDRVRILAKTPSGETVEGLVSFKQPPDVQSYASSIASSVSPGSDSTGYESAGNVSSANSPTSSPSSKGPDTPGSSVSAEDLVPLSTMGYREDEPRQDGGVSQSPTAGAEPVQDDGSPAEAAAYDDADQVGDSSCLNLTISSNRTAGYEGEISEYECILRNTGQGIVYNVSLECHGKNTTTTFLSPRREVRLDGAIAIDETEDITASVLAQDNQGRRLSKTQSLRIWKISPNLEIDAVAQPAKIHLGENTVVTVTARNTGADRLTDIRIKDSIGEIGAVASLEPGASATVKKEISISSSLADDIVADARDLSGRGVYAFDHIDLHVYVPGINLTVEPSEMVVYPGDDVDISWQVKNTGEERLSDITLAGSGVGRCRMKGLDPGETVKMAAIYSADDSGTGTVTVKAEGYGSAARKVSDETYITVRAIRPNLTLNVMPSQIDVCPGDAANVSCLVTNNGNDQLKNVVLSEAEEGVLANLGSLDSGEFRLVTPSLMIAGNRTLRFEATGKDTRGHLWKSTAVADARMVMAGLVLKAEASPESVRFGQKATIRCSIENRGSLPLYNIFVISKTFGPLGTIDYLPSKRSKTITAEKPVTMDVSDTITAQGFTAAKASVLDRKELSIGLKGSTVSRQQSETETLTTLSSAAPSAERAARASLNASASTEAAVQSGYSQIPDAAVALNSAGAVTSDDGIISGISRLVRYIRSLITGGSAEEGREEDSTAALSVQASTSYSGEEASANVSGTYEDYPLGIEGARDPGTFLSILDVTAMPTEPVAGEPVKIVLHASSYLDIVSASVDYGVADSSIARGDLLNMRRSSRINMTLDAGTRKEGYWSCQLPAQAEGTFVVLNVKISNGRSVADNGPYILQWAEKELRKRPAPLQLHMNGTRGEGMLYIESSSVVGTGEVSIKDTFNDNALEFHEDLQGIGDITMDSERCVNKQFPSVNFTEKRDMVFEDGFLKGFKVFDSPTFHGGMGASITERFNISQLDKSERGMIRSLNPRNNTLAFSTEQSFEGLWNTRTEYAKFNKKIKADQSYNGSFQTQKSISFQD